MQGLLSGGAQAPSLPRRRRVFRIGRPERPVRIFVVWGYRWRSGSEAFIFMPDTTMVPASRRDLPTHPTG